MHDWVFLHIQLDDNTELDNVKRCCFDALLCFDDGGLPRVFSDAGIGRQSVVAFGLFGWVSVASVGGCAGTARFSGLDLSTVHQCLLGVGWLLCVHDRYTVLYGISRSLG